MRKYNTKEKIILAIGLVAIGVSVYLGDYWIIFIVLLSYSFSWLWNKFDDKSKS